MIWLNGLARGKIVRIEPRWIDVVGRFDDAESEHLFPEVVHGGDRKLRLRGENAAIGIAPCFAGARLLTGRKIGGIDAGLAADRNARGLVAGGRVQVVSAL